MAKFKVGDKVKVIGLGPHSSYFGVTVGMAGTVMVQKSSKTDNVGVKFEEPIDGNCLYYNLDPILKGDDADKGLWIEPENLELIEEPEMTQQFKAMKIHIKDAIHSRMVQEALFEMGYKWYTRGEEVHNTHNLFLFVDYDGNITRSDSTSTFGRYEEEEVELVTTYSFKPVDQEAKRKREEKEALEKDVAEMQKQLDEMKQKLEKM